MTILRMESFDYGTPPDLAHWQAYGGIDSTQHRTGPQSYRCSGGPFGHAGLVGLYIGSETTAWAQFAYRRNVAIGFAPTSDTEYGLVGFWEGSYSGLHVNVGFNLSGQIIACRNKTEIAASTSTNLVALDEWQFHEVKVVLDNSNGSVLYRINGVEVLNATGLDTNNGGSYIGYVSFGSQQANMYGTYSAWFDDVIIGNSGDPVGDARVEYLVPNASGDQTQFTPSTGTNWSNVDETGTPTDTDYNYSSEVGAVDLFNMSSVGGNGIVHAVQPVLRVRKDDAGYRKVKPVLYKTLGDGDTPRLLAGAETAVTDTFAYHRQVMETDPDTGLAWTVEELPDIQFGYMVGGGGFLSLDAWIEEF